MWGKVAASAGGPPLSLHRLRHTHASLLLEAGVPLKVVQERLRHASYATTADLYSHVSSGMQQEAARAIESVLHPSS
jgi:integrase